MFCVKSSLRLDFTLYWSSPYGLDQCTHLRAYALRCFYCGPALTGWSTVYWSSPYGLDQYALQALRPEVQKEKYNCSSQPKVVSCSKLVQPLRAGPVYASQGLRPEMLICEIQPKAGFHSIYQLSF